jgi:hypothetical protein
MRRIILIYFYFIYSHLYQAQLKIKPVYGANLNNLVERITYKDMALEANNKRGLGFYLHLGLQSEIDSVFVLQTSLRYGREISNFEVFRNGSLLYETYYFSNRTLTFFLSPGIIINKKQKLFLNLGITRFYQSNVGGGGQRSNGNAYTYAIHLNRDDWDYRLGLKWQVKPWANKKLNFEIGAEASFMEQRSIIEIKSSYNNQPSELYRLSYSNLLIYFGISFSKGKATAQIISE